MLRLTGSTPAASKNLTHAFGRRSLLIWSLPVVKRSTLKSTRYGGRGRQYTTEQSEGAVVSKPPVSEQRYRGKRLITHILDTCRIFPTRRRCLIYRRNVQILETFFRFSPCVLEHLLQKYGR